MAQALLERVRWIEGRGGGVVSPSRVTVRHPRETDWHTYKERHLVEKLFLRLKDDRRSAIRYEEKAVYFQAVTFIACILIWLL